MPQSYTLAVDSLHNLLGWLPQKLGNQDELMHMVSPREENFPENHLCQNTSNAPHIHGVVVVLPGQHDLRRAVVSSGDVAGHLGVLFSGQAKVTNFQVAVIVDQNVAWLEVAVNDSGRMNVF